MSYVLNLSLRRHKDTRFNMTIRYRIEIRALFKLTIKISNRRDGCHSDQLDDDQIF